MTVPNYHCPVCGTLSTLVIGPTQAVCTADTCPAVTFNPSLPDGGMGNVSIIDWSSKDPSGGKAEP